MRNASVDSTWKVTQEKNDLCASDLQMGTIEPSGYSKNPTTFSCGPTAASLVACTAKAGYATCIQDYARRVAVRFPSKATKPTAHEKFTPTPLQVRLANGFTCDFSSHDQTRHYDDRMSWLYCDHDSFLLLPRGDDGKNNAYFDKRSPSWTAQLSVGMAAPTIVGVTKVVYAS